jgi:RNA polymerase sigma factor (sigma-70 family)
LGNLKNTSDAKLTFLIKTGVKDAFQELFERYEPRIYSFSFSYLQNAQDSEELVQDVFLKIWENRASLDKTKNTKAFIFKVAVNTIYDFIRRKNNRKCIPGPFDADRFFPEFFFKTEQVQTKSAYTLWIILVNVFSMKNAFEDQ